MEDFKVGEYIVYLGQHHTHFHTNHIFKIRSDSETFYPERDSEGNINNGWGAIKRSNTRPATWSEIQEYNKVGKPYDVTKSPAKSLYQQAVERGYVKGAIFKDLIHNEPFAVRIDNGITGAGRESDTMYIQVVPKNGFSNKSACIYKDGKWADIVVSAKNDDLLEEAKRRYPVGTTFKPAHVHNGGEYTIKENDVFVHENNSVSIYIKDKYTTEGYMTCVHSYNKEWATVVKQEQNPLLEVAKKKYPKGTIVNNSNVIGHSAMSFISEGELSTSGHIIQLRSGNNVWYTIYRSDIWADVKGKTEEPIESELDKWLRETKAMNLGIAQLTIYIGNDTPQKIYKMLEGTLSAGKAEILYNKWNNLKDNIVPSPTVINNSTLVSVETVQEIPVLERISKVREFAATELQQPVTIK